MSYAIIGFGAIGQALARAFARNKRVGRDSYKNRQFRF